MTKIRPFAAFRPQPELAERVAGLPYDVLHTEEARLIAANNPRSFLHVSKSEIDLPKGTDPFCQLVYETAGKNLRRLQEDGTLVQEEKPCFYLYRQVRLGRAQIGIVGCLSTEEYGKNVKVHEATRQDKEDDRTQHILACNAQAGPIFCVYPDQTEVDAITGQVMQEAPLYDFTFAGKPPVQQTVWRITDEAKIAALEQAFTKVPSVYIADGHHRSAAAARVAEQRHAACGKRDCEAEYSWFMSVLFPASQLCVLDYNRVLTDLNGLSKEEFLEKVAERFEVTPISASRPTRKHTFSMNLMGSWYRLVPKPGTFDENDPVGRLDTEILQRNLLQPVLGVDHPKTDPRIDFVGGARGIEGLSRRVEDDAVVAFAMWPTEICDMFRIADAGLQMPPKSTWFEPKLLSGLFVHDIS